MALNFIRNKDVVLHVGKAPQGNGQPVVFINSLGTDGRIWNDVVDRLGPDFAKDFRPTLITLQSIAQPQIKLPIQRRYELICELAVRVPQNISIEEKLNLSAYFMRRGRALADGVAERAVTGAAEGVFGDGAGAG